jgi:hypothetical protein
MYLFIFRCYRPSGKGWGHNCKLHPVCLQGTYRLVGHAGQLWTSTQSEQNRNGENSNWDNACAFDSLSESSFPDRTVSTMEPLEVVRVQWLTWSDLLGILLSVFICYFKHVIIMFKYTLTKYNWLHYSSVHSTPTSGTLALVSTIASSS